MTDIEEKPEIRLDLAHAVWDFGDITMYLTWTLSDRRPAMVLIPRFSKDFVPYVIKMDGAYVWTDTIVGDPIAQERGAGAAAACMGFDPFNHSLRRRIISIIQGRLQDLLTMPPLVETGEVAARADLTLTDMNTGKVVEIEGKVDV